MDLTTYKKYKAEPLDVMQYFYGSVHEPFIHGFIQVKDHIDVLILKRAVTLSLKAAPVLGCCFVESAWHPYWKAGGFTGEDIVKVCNIEERPMKNVKELDEEKIINRLLATPLDIYKGPQLKINLFKGKDNDTICVIINHMVTDGVGFKEYMYMLCNLYSKLEKNIDYNPTLKAYPRSTGLIFQNFSTAEKLQIIFSKYDYSKQKQQSGVFLEGDKNNPLFITHNIAREEFTGIKSYVKKQGITVNDMLLTAYARLLYKKAGMERCIIPCPVNLRKYLSDHQKHGISNFISYYYCDINIKETDSFRDTLSLVASQMTRQKESLNSLKSIIMLETAFHFIPFFVLKKYFLKSFAVPMFSLTNFGVLDKNLLKFGKNEISEVYLTATIKYVPYNQIVITTYDDSCTLSCNLYGTLNDKVWIKDFLRGMEEEILTVMD
jgi:NRPS condensation-like uncharacterized protein